MHEILFQGLADSNDKKNELTEFSWSLTWFLQAYILVSSWQWIYQTSMTYGSICIVNLYFSVKAESSIPNERLKVGDNSVKILAIRNSLQYVSKVFTFPDVANFSLIAQHLHSILLNGIIGFTNRDCDFHKSNWHVKAGHHTRVERSIVTDICKSVNFYNQEDSEVWRSPRMKLVTIRVVILSAWGVWIV